MLDLCSHAHGIETLICVFFRYILNTISYRMRGVRDDIKNIMAWAEDSLILIRTLCILPT